MKPIISSFLFLLCCFGCHKNENKSGKPGNGSATEIAFDKNKWRLGSDDYYPYRDKMIKDLVGKAKLKGLKKDEVLTLLGGDPEAPCFFYFAC